MLNYSHLRLMMKNLGSTLLLLACVLPLLVALAQALAYM
ncbi:hypothetical protein A2U01_0105621, partial [Trifolium medium]|nr:hypothetical protein [Trifolium medium]